MQKSGRRGGRYAGCDIIPRASRRAADRIFRRPADSLPPFFSCFARKQRAAAREACSGRYRTVVCLPLTSTLLDKDNAPSLIRFGSLSSTRAGKNLDRSQEQVTSSFYPPPRVIREERLFTKKWNNTRGSCDEFLFIHVPAARNTALATRKIRSKTEAGGGRKRGNKKRDENRSIERGFKGKRGTMDWLPFRTNSFANSFNDVTTR